MRKAFLILAAGTLALGACASETQQAADSWYESSGLALNYNCESLQSNFDAVVAEESKPFSTMSQDERAMKRRAILRRMGEVCQ